MSEMALRFRVEAEMAEAKAALDQGAAAFRKFGAEAQAAVGKASSSYDTFATSQTRAIGAMKSNAGITGNVAAQFNDIGVMLAAGQNPFQLAIQQGTQLGQALQQAGGGIKGATEALRSGFMAMISPTTLLTIGLIAGGAALVQWAMSAREAVNVAKAAKEANDAFASSFSALRSDISETKGLHNDYIEAVKSGNEEMIAAIGREAEVRQKLMVLNMLDLSEKETAAQKAVAAERAAMDAAQQSVDTRLAQLATLNAAKDKAEKSPTFGGTDPASLAAEIEITNAALAVETAELEKQQAAFNRNNAEYELLGAQIDVNNAKLYATSALLAQIADGTAPLVTGMNDAAGAGQSLWDVILGAAGAADMLASSGPKAGWLAGAIGDAETLFGKLWAAGTQAANLRYNRIGTTDGPAGIGNLIEQYSQYGAGRTAATAATNPLYNPPPPPAIPSSGTSGTSGSGPASGSLAALTAEAAKATSSLDLAISTINEKVKAGLMSTAEAADAVTSAKDKSANAIAELIAQIDRLGPSGAAQAEQLRVALASMAAGLQKPISDLAKDLAGALTEPLKEFMKGTVSAKDAFNKMGDSIINKMIDIAAKRAQTNFLEPLINGFFNSFGGSGIGKAIAGAFGAKARGGLIAGDGTGTSDSIPTMLSNGEFVINAAATAGNLALLTAINSGKKIVGPTAPPPIEIPQWPVSAALRRGAVSAGAAGQMPAPQIKVSVTGSGVAAGSGARVEQSGAGMDQMLNIIIEKVDNAIGARVRNNSSAAGMAMAGTYGLNRNPR